MERPPRLSSQKAVAQYLAQQVGEGGMFTVADLRQFASSAEQVGRRMRQLRAMGWTINSKNHEPTLAPGQYRLITVGGLVSPKSVSNRTRREVFDRAQNRCQVCGIGEAGETYADPPGEQARLQLGHWVPMDQGGDPTNPSNLQRSATDATRGFVTRLERLSRRRRCEFESQVCVLRRNGSYSFGWAQAKDSQAIARRLTTTGDNCHQLHNK